MARDLLGKLLIRRVRGRTVLGRITEVEAYHGEDDLACHASRGRTPRTETLYARPGTAYVYLIYGMHHCLNVVTEREGFPAAVLIRSCVPASSTSPAEHPTRSMVGPGRLCRTFRITRAENGLDTVTSMDLWLADDRTRVRSQDIRRTPRIGVAYAGRSAAWPWRFIWREKPHTGSPLQTAPPDLLIRDVATARDP